MDKRMILSKPSDLEMINPDLNPQAQEPKRYSESSILPFLESLQKGSLLIVKNIQGPLLIQNRLKELGIQIGKTIIYRGRSPLGGPILFQIEATVVALRIEEAECLRFE